MIQHRHTFWLVILLAVSLAAGCTLAPEDQSAPAASSDLPASAAAPSETAPRIPSVQSPYISTTAPGAPVRSPTPDLPRILPTMRSEEETYIVQPGDTLGKIARGKGIRVADIVTANDIANPDLLEVGQVLTIPAPTPRPPGPAFKIIPDSELVYGPVSASFNVDDYVRSQQGYLSQYHEEILDETLTGAQIITRVAENFSVNPRLLLAILEYQSGWVTRTNPKAATLEFPLGYADPWRAGLYLQMSWAANNLNRGYYLWRVNGISHYILTDGSYVPPNTTLNAGSVGVQYWASLLFDYPTWLVAVSENGLYQTYARLFSQPFQFAVEPLLPANLAQPALQLPFEDGASWSFTGGPHGGWGDGSAWAALDFAPPGEALGCVESDAWVTAATDGIIVRAFDGAVIQDLDGDGFEQTGWVILYMHIQSRDRVQPGTHLQAGERIGHPSCEGGISSGTHMHIARRYNGEWIAADGAVPFNLDNWISLGYGIEYDGELRKNGKSIEAWVGRRDENQISR